MGGPVEHFRIDYTKEDLANVPEDDVVFFFMMCQLQNDTAALLRLIFSNWPDDTEESDPVMVNRAITCLLAMRMLAGRMEEGWKGIKDLFGRSFINYQMSDSTREAYATIRAYFSHENVIRAIRDNAAHHHEREPMRAAWRQIPDEHEFSDFTARGLGNTVYWGAENVLTANAIIIAQQFRPELDRKQALEWLLKEISHMSDLFMKVTTGYCLGFYQTHLPKQLARMKDNKFVEPDQPGFHEVRGASFMFGTADDNADPKIRNRHERRATEKRDRVRFR